MNVSIWAGVWSSVKMGQRVVPAARANLRDVEFSTPESGVSRFIRAVPEGILLAVGLLGRRSRVKQSSDPADDIDRAHHIKL